MEIKYYPRGFKKQKHGKVKKSTLRAAKRGKKIIGGEAVKAGAQEVRKLRQGDRKSVV